MRLADMDWSIGCFLNTLWRETDILLKVTNTAFSIYSKFILLKRVNYVETMTNVIKKIQLKRILCVSI